MKWIARDLGLEAAIAEDKEALEPYLVYADWLQERGDPRGELIMIQIAMAGAQDAAALTELRRRELVLFRDHHDYLCAPLPTIGASSYHRRGFIDRIDVWTEQGLADVLTSLTVDHPATRFLSHLRLAYGLEHSISYVRARLVELGRDCRVWVGHETD